MAVQFAAFFLNLTVPLPGPFRAVVRERDVLGPEVAGGAMHTVLFLLDAVQSLGSRQSAHCCRTVTMTQHNLVCYLLHHVVGG